MPADFAQVPARLLEQFRGFKIPRPLKIMEVCGTHTHAIHRYGIHKLLPEGVRLVSGPGCPVCVTTTQFIDEAIFLARQGLAIATFGDLLRVPGSDSSLERERAAGATVRLVYSPLEALQYAQSSSARVVFLAVGFETTAPAIAYTARKARRDRVANYFLLAGNRRVPPALAALLQGARMIDGFLLPGHVSVTIGRGAYLFLERCGVPGVIAGFEPLDLVAALLHLLRLIVAGQAQVRNEYRRAVREDGNPDALALLREVFVERDAEWRGLGQIPESGLFLNGDYEALDIRRLEDLGSVQSATDPTCRCGEVLQGLIDPPQCPQFGKACLPESPRGPCMVASEGSCSAWYRHG